jgi:hypothetical protein
MPGDLKVFPIDSFQAPMAVFRKEEYRSLYCWTVLRLRRTDLCGNCDLGRPAAKFASTASD